MNRRCLAALITGVAILLYSNAGFAGPFDAVVNPGALYKGHAKLEKECKQCHKPFSKSAQNSLCANCHEHKDVALDILKKRGFHGRITQQDCKTCHTEHKGRSAKIVRLNERQFDHLKTDFVLRGKHKDKKLTCDKCHEAGKKHRDAPSQCLSCHAKKDVHKGSLGKRCEDCHSALGWKKVQFDHSKTDYPLVGKHRDVSCKACHKSKNHKNTPKSCQACHRKDDEHRGNFGNRCKNCHTPKDWTISLFNHGRATKYRLRGQHSKIKCTSCHKGNLFKEKLKTSCIACHKSDDVHKGQEGQQCGNCHNERSWKKTVFDHGLTAFPLLGKHAKVKCKQCHKAKTYKDAPVPCVACHRKDDEHRGKLGEKCETCHNARAWKNWVFDHNRQTNFALTGKHKPLECAACHIQAMKKVSLPGTCNSCHSRDDVHDGGFGKLCERCHVDTSWSRIRNLPSMRH